MMNIEVLQKMTNIPLLCPQATHGDMERGHSWSPRRPDFASPSELPKEPRPLRHWVGVHRMWIAWRQSLFCSYNRIWGRVTDKTVCMCVSLQEVYSGPLRFMSDTVFDDPWSHLFMSTLAPRKYVKVRMFSKQPRTHAHTLNNNHFHR